MDCKKCGTPAAEGAMYCRNCGTRVDGKMPCPSCAELNDDINVYCIYCGNRMDGKAVCSSCGTAHVGSFCPSCGTPSVAAKTSAPKAAKNKSGGGVEIAKKVLDITGGGLAMLGVLFALIFVFFIAVVAEIPGELATESQGLFYYFGDYYRELKELELSSMGMSDWFVAFTERQGLFMGIFGTVVSVAVLVFVLLFATLATVTYIRNWLGFTQKKADKWVVACIASFFIGAATFLCLHKIGVSADASSIRLQFEPLNFNGATKAGLWLCTVTLGMYVCCKAVRLGFEKKKQMLAKENILRMVFAFVGVALASVVFTLAQNTGVVLEVMNDEANASMSLSFLTANMTFAGMFGALGNEYAGYSELTMQMEMLTWLNLIVQVLLVAVIVLSALVLFKNLKVFTDDGKKTCLLLSIFTLACSVVLLVLAVISWGCLAEAFVLSETSANYTTNLACPICLVVFSLLQMAAAIVRGALQKRAEEQTV